MPKQYAELQTMIETPVKFQSNYHTTVGGVALYNIPSIYSFLPPKWLRSFCEKSDKNKLRIMPKQYTHLQIMALTPVKFEAIRENCRRSSLHKMPSIYSF